MIDRGAAPQASTLRGREARAALLQTLTVPVWNPTHAGAVLGMIAALERDVRLMRLKYPLTSQTGQWILSLLDS